MEETTEKTSRYAIGDTVRLKSGGPPMTVSALPADQTRHLDVICTWFTKDGQLCSAEFRTQTLDRG